MRKELWHPYLFKIVNINNKCNKIRNRILISVYWYKIILKLILKNAILNMKMY